MKKPLKPGFQPFLMYPGVNIEGKWGGMRKEGASHKLPKTKFRHLENVRLVGGEVQSRGGQNKINAAALGGTEVTGIYDDSGGAESWGGRLYYVMEASVALPPGLYMVGPNLSPTLYYSDGDVPEAIGTEDAHLGRAAGSIGDTLYALTSLIGVGTPQIYSVDLADNSFTLAASPTNDPVYRTFCDHAGAIWFVDGTTGDVCSFDGSSITVEDAAALSGAQLMFSFNSDLYAFGDGWCKYRNGGLWSSIAIPVTIDPDQIWISHCTYGGDAYIGGQDADAWYQGRILKLTTGNVLTHEHTAGGISTEEPPTEAPISGLATDGTYLYYTHHNVPPTGGRTAEVGIYNGAVWSDSQADLLDQVGADLAINRLAYYDGLLFAGCTNGKLYAVEVTDITAVWDDLTATGAIFNETDDAWGGGISGITGIYVVTA